ncbi:hypothetical protein ACET3Z_016503 [Daucus carota]
MDELDKEETEVEIVDRCELVDANLKGLSNQVSRTTELKIHRRNICEPEDADLKDLRNQVILDHGVKSSKVL